MSNSKFAIALASYGRAIFICPSFPLRLAVDLRVASHASHILEGILEQITFTGKGNKSASMTCFCPRSEEHTSELQSLMRISYAVFCLKKKTQKVSENTRQNTNTEK